MNRVVLPLPSRVLVPSTRVLIPSTRVLLPAMPSPRTPTSRLHSVPAGDGGEHVAEVVEVSGTPRVRSSAPSSRAQRHVTGVAEVPPESVVVDDYSEFMNLASAPPATTALGLPLSALSWKVYAVGAVLVGCVLYTGWSLFFRKGS